jgi:hypothetical protein
VDGGGIRSQPQNLYFTNLRCGFLQLDELTANIRGDKDLTDVWTAIDARSKIILERCGWQTMSHACISGSQDTLSRRP